MATHLDPDDHIAALVRSGTALHAAATAASLDAPVPTCPAWDVASLVAHQGMVHRWAAANLRGEKDHRPSASQAEAKATADLLGWYSDGLAGLVDTLRDTADDAKAMVFLNDAPPPRGRRPVARAGPRPVELTLTGILVGGWDLPTRDDSANVAW